MSRTFWPAIGFGLFVALGVQFFVKLGPRFEPSAPADELLIPALAVRHAVLTEKVDFSKDVEPILAQFCYDCHGPDSKSRKAGLRLDTRAGLLGKTRSGVFAVVPCDGDSSEVLRRIGSADAGEKMPPPRTDKKLSDAQVDTLRRWIAEGAVVTEHWAFQPISRPPVPETPWGVNPIDHFIQARLQAKGLRPARQAPRDVLIKRLKMDLLGLPPTLAEIAGFVSDPDPEAYEKLVDRYLNSPHYGEKMALHWLDGARYADTYGGTYDGARPSWTYRDWVIQAFNRHMKFDEFTRLQLAGDYLPGIQPRDLVATAFYRCGLRPGDGNNTPEDREEHRIKMLTEMVNTTAKVWLGLTFECAQCHDHKYDPITQMDYYQLLAFFNALPASMIGRTVRDKYDNAEPAIALEWPVVKGPGAAATPVPTSCMVMKDAAFEPTFVLERGDFRSKGPRVPAGFPAAFPAADRDASATTRLDLAHWLLERANPLTARVVVNRLWEQYFGLGLAANSDNLGKQGARPTHPELLDWLAAELCDRDWDLQHVQRLILTSATYRQASLPVPVPGTDRPDFVGFPRQRLQAELIRDKVLAVAGLLDERLGGPPVFPVIPPADVELTRQVRDNSQYQASNAPERYRRSVYLNVKRSLAYALFAAFDVPKRDCCVITRPTTNTPLQALALLNDPFVIDSAKHLAGQTLQHVDGTAEHRVASVFQRALGRPPQARELALLLKHYTEGRDYFRSHPGGAEQFLAPSGTPSAATPPEDMAALALVGNLVFNLDEFLNKQ